MDNLNKLIDIVEDVLRNSQTARNSDDALYLAVVGKINPIALSMPVMDVLLKRNVLGLPHYESVSRTRRTVVKLYPELAGDDEVEAQRIINEEEFREFAKRVV